MRGRRARQGPRLAATGTDLASGEALHYARSGRPPHLSPRPAREADAYRNWSVVVVDDLHFKNMRFDPDVTDFHAIAQQMAARYGYEAELSIDRRMATLLRLRVAQLNPCSYCLILHTRVAAEAGIDPDVVAHLPSWRHSTLFTAGEGLALSYCEALTQYDHANFDSVYRGLSLVFSQVEIAEIAAVVINMNVWTRLKLAQGAIPFTPESATPDAPSAADA